MSKYFRVLTPFGGYPYDAAVLEDGTYDVLVVDAEAVDEPAGAIRVELTILAGPSKGDVFSLTAVGLGRDPLDLLAEPGTVTVANGVPALVLEG